MSDISLNANYMPEEHAPEPVVSHGDPIMPGKLAIWLFLASEIMFFIGLLGTYIVLRSGSPKMFAAQGAMLDKVLAGVNTLVLILSSLTVALAVDAAQKGNRARLIFCLVVTIICACGFMFIKGIEYNDKFHHYTILTKEGKGKDLKNFIYDGHLLSNTITVNGNIEMPKGTRFVTWKDQDQNEFIGAVTGKTGDQLQVQLDDSDKKTVTIAADKVTTVESGKVHWKTIKLHARRREVPRTEEINVHLFSPAADPIMNPKSQEGATEKIKEQIGTEKAEKEIPEEEYTIDYNDINDYTWYGPQKNPFFSCYFVLTGIHGLHVIGGIFPMVFLLVHALRGKILPAHTEYVGLYWHFVDIVWIFLFPMLYLI